jgi:hypothetical protein
MLCFLVMSMLLIFIYFCVMFFGDVHVAHLYIFLCYVFWWCPCCSATWTSPNNITQKYIKMSNMDITKKHNTEIYKDEQHGHHQTHVAHLYIFLCYVFWWYPCCSSLYISVLCFLVISMLLIFIYFCGMFFGDVHVVHLYIFQ